jgi:hypothetical protein
MTRPGSHPQTYQPAPTCDACQRPMRPTGRSAVWECDHTDNQPLNVLGLNNSRPTKPRRPPPTPGPFGPMRYREPGDHGPAPRNRGGSLELGSLP